MCPFMEPEKSTENNSSVYSRGIIGVRKETEGIAWTGEDASVLVSCCCDKVHDKGNLRKRFLLGHSFRRNTAHRGEESMAVEATRQLFTLLPQSGNGDWAGGDGDGL